MLFRFVAYGARIARSGHCDESGRATREIEVTHAGCLRQASSRSSRRSPSALALAAASAPTTRRRAGYKAALVSDVAGFNDNGFNKNQLMGLNKAAKAARGSRRFRSSRTRRATTSRTTTPRSSTTARRSIIAAGLPARRHGEEVREAVSEDQVRDHRRSGRVPSAGSRTRRASPTRRRRAAASSASSRRRWRKKMGGKVNRRGRRHQDPAGRLVHRRLQVLREQGGSGHEDDRLSTRTTSPTSPSARRARRTRSARGRR